MVLIIRQVLSQHSQVKTSQRCQSLNHSTIDDFFPPLEVNNPAIVKSALEDSRTGTKRG